MDVNEESVRELHEAAQKAAEKNAYSLNNPYTSRDEKIEIEYWYQLPSYFAGVTYLIAAFLWSQSILNGWQAYFFGTARGRS